MNKFILKIILLQIENTSIDMHIIVFAFGYLAFGYLALGYLALGYLDQSRKA